MKTKTIWKIHSWVGLICGIALLVIGLSGSILVFHQEIETKLRPDWVTVEKIKESGRLPLEQLVSTVETRFPDYWVRGWLPRYSSKFRDQAFLKHRGSDNDWYMLHVDPYNGESAPRPLAYPETIYGWFVELHYTFFADQIGLAFVAFFGLGFLLLGLSGFYLYRDFWKSLFRLRWKRSARIFFSDLHKMIGILAMPINLILGVTGVYWNTTHLMLEVMSEIKGEEHDPLEHPYPGGITKQLPLLIENAQAHWSDFELNYLYFPIEGNGKIRFYGQTPSTNPLRSPYGSWIQLDVESGEIETSSDLRTANIWRKITDAFEPLHFGDFGGITTKIIWCITGLTPSILFISGFIMWWKRSRKKSDRNN